MISTGQANAPFPERIKYFILPVMVLVLPNIAYFARFMRSSMLEVNNQDYVTVARAKGLPNKTVLYRHALTQRADPDDHSHRFAAAADHRRRGHHRTDLCLARIWAIWRSRRSASGIIRFLCRSPC